MAKKFAPRISKSARKTIDLAEKLDRDLFKVSDDKLLRGARLDEMRLKDITVKEQVRTKFNDASLRDLGENIRVNGLIQPLVVHYKQGVYTLICGERRYRAMTLIQMEKAPCFILENKSEEELMAIQFSENSARESLHYIDRADGILNYQKTTKASERKIQTALGISKSEVHRSLMIARMPAKLKEAAKLYDIEKYVLVEFEAIDNPSFKKEVEKQVLAGKITKRSQLKTVMTKGVVSPGRKKAAEKKVTLPRGASASAFLKAMESRSKDLKLDKKTRELFKTLVEETKEIVDL
jgi:ParB family transcriptional regulator, chromosome partitioning protein